PGGDGGGEKGVSPYTIIPNSTQSSGCNFGNGQNGRDYSNNYNYNYNNYNYYYITFAGGGGGWWGGWSDYNNNYNYYNNNYPGGAGGGGSGYIGGCGIVLGGASMETGINSGNGRARITPL
ncbi:hypothetical protein NO2_1722, partial [Candidatus Termititenax persephonae]